MSNFIEGPVLTKVVQQQAQTTFLARELASREHAQTTGRYVSSTVLLAKLEARLRKAK